MDTLPVWDVTGWAVVEAEAGGGGEKEWLEAPDRVRWRFKPRTEHDTWVEGEDWAEAVVGELANRLAVPAADAALAVRFTCSGSVSRNLRPRAGSCSTAPSCFGSTCLTTPLARKTAPASASAHRETSLG